MLAKRKPRPAAIFAVDNGVFRESVINHWSQLLSVELMKHNSLKIYSGYAGYGGRPAANIRSCYQWTGSDYMPAGFMRVRNSIGDAVLGGSREFMVEEIEVLHVMD
ncbi:unnamed protein product [Vitrella brassicaformis CCMP3155]|uniref:TLDc domain-containing protein n=1 Tax=Vitrella brassicaformis (strain CCMP3155) TaxID=1169540 RepID=A0A0G4EMW3_VITBC|nr:unnamed protein product [Vitrella brassicaformis CCMP3155]|eukprot:CEL98357.1 unnamed protein product [Vitrella brassicaformis CCMP3155]